MGLRGAITIRLGSWIAPAFKGRKSASVGIREPFVLVGYLNLLSACREETHESLRQSDFAHVDRYEQGFLHELIIPLIGVNSALRRDEDPADIAILRGVVETGGSAEDIDRVVVPAEQTVRPKAGDLLASVTFHAVGKGDF